VPTNNTVDLDTIPNSQLVLYPDAGHGGVSIPELVTALEFYESSVRQTPARRPASADVRAAADASASCDDL